MTRSYRTDNALHELKLSTLTQQQSVIGLSGTPYLSMPEYCKEYGRVPMVQEIDFRLILTKKEVTDVLNKIRSGTSLDFVRG